MAALEGPQGQQVAGVPPTSVQISSVLHYPDRFSAAQLVAELAVRLMGKSATGVTIPLSVTGAPYTSVVWADAGSEVLVHLDSVQVRLTTGSAIISVDLECDQTGRTPLVIALALGTTGDPAGLIATTDEFPRGNGTLTARWGAAVQSAVWSSLLNLVHDYAAERNTTAVGMSVVDGVFVPVTGDPLMLPLLARRQ